MASISYHTEPFCETRNVQVRDLGLHYACGAASWDCCRPTRRIYETEFQEPMILLQDDACRPLREGNVVSASAAPFGDCNPCAVDSYATGRRLAACDPCIPCAAPFSQFDSRRQRSTSLGAEHTGEDLAAENARLRGLLSGLSRTFQDRFEELAARRDGDYLDLLGKFQAAAGQPGGAAHLSGSAGRPTAGLAGRPTASLVGGLAAGHPGGSGALSKVKKSAATKAAPPPSSALKGAKTPGKVTKPVVRPIRVLVKEATGLLCPEAGRPQVQLELHGVVKETTSHDPSPNPVWNQQLILPEKAGAGKRRLRVVAKTQFGEVGEATVELPSYAVSTDIWVPVSKAGKATGNVHLIVDAPDGDEAVALPNNTRRPPPRAPLKASPGRERPRPTSPQPDVEFPDDHMGIPTQRPVAWDLVKMDGEKFWVCLVAKDGHLVLDPAEYKKAPALWTMSQASTEAIFNAYNSSFQTSMRRRGLNKLNSYWQKEINDMKGIYLSHLDEGSALRTKEEQILKLEKQLAEAEASRDDLAGKLVESQTLLTEKAHQMRDLNEEMNAELSSMVEARRQQEERRFIEDENLLQLMQTNRDWAWRTQARMFEMDHETLEGLTAEELVAEVNALRDELQRQQLTNQQMKDRLQMLEDSSAVRDAVTSGRPVGVTSPAKKQLY